MRVLASAAAALIGAGLLLSELALTRLFGYLYSPARVFSILGLGAFGAAAGALAAHRLGWHPRRRPAILAAGAALAGTLTVLGAVAGTTGALGIVGLGVLEIIAGYFGAAAFGAALASLAGLDPAAAGWVGGALFLGAAGGAALFTPLANALQPTGAALVGAALTALAALPAALGAIARRLPASDVDDEDGGALGRVVGWGVVALLAIVPLIGVATQLPLRWLNADPERIAGGKSLFNSVGVGAESERMVLSRWDAHSRIDVTEHAQNPTYRWVYQDGSFVGRMYRVSGTGAPLDALRQDISFLAFYLPGAKERVLVAGAGGGQEVLTALSTGAAQVVVAEPSAALVAAARAQADYNGGVFDRPNVRVVAQDARTYLRESGEQFDLILLTLGATGVAEPEGASAGAGLLTLEGYAALSDGLKRDGRLIVPLRDQEELLRAFNTAFQLGLQRGAKPIDAIRRLIALNNQPVAQARSEEGDVIALPLLLIRKTPYLESEIRETAAALGQSPYPPLFLPHFEQQSSQLSPVSAAMAAMAEVGPSVVEANVPWDIRPANDARPFFYEGIEGIPLVQLALLIVGTGLTAGLAWLARRPSGEAIELVDQLDTEAAAFLEATVPWRYVGFATLVGAAWGLLVLPLLNRLPHLLGQPAVSAPLIYGALFAGAAAGAVLAQLGGAASLRPVIGWAGLA
ncbi:MAG TPA: hypothetical protein VFX49_12425, partial [Chloroflexota bacterium]|nr:hypothetical protein [Chloroflexota bacterium]